MLINRHHAIAATAILAVIGAGMAASRVQTASPPLRRVGGHTDLSGVWQGPYVPDMTRDGRGQMGEPRLPFTPEGEKDWESYDAANGDYTGSCLPFGLSRSMNAPNPQKGDLIEYLCEENNKDLREGHIRLWTAPGAR